MPKKILTKTEFAKLQGVSRETVSRWISRGKLPADCFTAEGRVRVTRARKALSENLSPAHVKAAAMRGRLTNAEATETATAAGINPGNSMAEMQRLLTGYKAALKKLEYDRESGLLVNRDEVILRGSTCARQTRDAILNVPDRVAAILAAESKEDIVREILTKELRDALEQLVNEFSKEIKNGQ